MPTPKVGNPFVNYDCGYAVCTFLMITIATPVWAKKLAMDEDGTIKAYESELEPNEDLPNGKFINPEPSLKVETIASVPDEIFRNLFGEWRTTITDIVFNVN